MTPFLLAALAGATGNRSTAANIELLENNARVAAEIAGAMRVSDAAGL
ncbi:MAG TPA: pseudouridine-5'-phosphate glycosidase [Myxococcales bacterium]